MQEFVVLDFETTGLNPRKVKLGLVKPRLLRLLRLPLISLISIPTMTYTKNPQGDRVIEVGAAIVKGDEIISKFSSLCKPYDGIEIPKFITNLT
jgi:DNA polymerase III epsilon subunit-like protein